MNNRLTEKNEETGEYRVILDETADKHKGTQIYVDIIMERLERCVQKLGAYEDSCYNPEQWKTPIEKKAEIDKAFTEIYGGIHTGIINNDQYTGAFSMEENKILFDDIRCKTLKLHELVKKERDFNVE